MRWRARQSRVSSQSSANSSVVVGDAEGRTRLEVNVVNILPYSPDIRHALGPVATSPVANTLSYSSCHGLWRSLVAHLTGGQGVASSNLVSPTRHDKWPPFWAAICHVAVCCHRGPRRAGSGASPPRDCGLSSGAAAYRNLARVRLRCDGRAGGAQPPQRRRNAHSRHVRSTTGRGRLRLLAVSPATAMLEVSRERSHHR